MKKRTAIKTDLFADEHHRENIDTLGDPLAEIGSYIDFGALGTSQDSCRPPYPTETMVRILALKRLDNLSDEQMEYQLLDRMSYKRFCGLLSAVSIPDRTTVGRFDQPEGRRTAEGWFRAAECGFAAQNRIGEAGAKVLFDGVTAQLLKHGFISRGGPIVDATLEPAPKQRNSREENKLVKEGAISADWKPAKRRRKDTDATWTQKHGKNHFGCKLSINVDKKYKVIRKFETGTASIHDSKHPDAIIDRGNTSRAVYANRGHTSADREN